jgi:multidrug resistance efflux pump
MLKKTILTLVALTLTAGSILGGWWYLHREPATLALPGIVEIQEVRLSSKVGGRVERVAVAEGDLVKAGQPLVYLEAPELLTQAQQAQAKLDAAQADLDKARNGSRPEEIESARAAMESVKARWERLKAGSRKEEIDQARADLESAQADLTNYERNLRRITQMIAERAATPADYDAAVASRDRYQGKTASAKAHLNLLLAGTRQEEIDEAAADLDKAKANYELLRQGTRSEEIAAAEAKVAELRGRVEELKVNLKEAVVLAPEPAVVEVLAVRKGDVVAPNQSVLRMLRADDLWVKIYVPETELGKVRLHQNVTVTIDSYPDRRFDGEVIQIASSSEYTPRNVQSADERKYQVFAVKVRVADPQGIFKSGMAANVVVPLHD